MSRECPECMPKHRADLASPDVEMNGVRSEGWLQPSAEIPGAMVCNCCGLRLADTDPALADAIQALEAMAAGTLPDHLQVLTGALALSRICMQGADRDLLDAAAGLDALATGRKLDLNEAGRARAAKLAARVRCELLEGRESP